MLNRFIELAELHAKIDYSDSESEKIANRAANEMIMIAESVGTDISVEEFASLLKHPIARKWAAHHLIELLNVSGPLLQESLKTIRDVANSDDPDAFGEEMWLNEWVKRH